MNLMFHRFVWIPKKWRKHGVWKWNCVMYEEDGIYCLRFMDEGISKNRKSRQMQEEGDFRIISVSIHRIFSMFPLLVLPRYFTDKMRGKTEVILFGLGGCFEILTELMPLNDIFMIMEQDNLI